MPNRKKLAKKDISSMEGSLKPWFAVRKNQPPLPEGLLEFSRLRHFDPHSIIGSGPGDVITAEDLVKQLKIDTRNIAGSGPGGSITIEDLNRACKTE